MNSNSSYKKFEPFSYKSLDDLKNMINALHLDIPISSDLKNLKQEVKIKNINTPHRLAIQPMEGFDSNEDGSPSKLTIRRYKRYKKGIIISDEELEKLEDLWVEKAMLAKDIGFDGVDIKACHGYLISELLASRTRKDSVYGGISFDKRAKFLLNIVKKIKNELKNNSNFLITTRLGVYDGIPYPNGFGIIQERNQIFPAPIDLSEPLELINKLYKLGVRLINISAGNPHYNPVITRPYDAPTKGGRLPLEHPLYSIARLIKLTSNIRRILPKDMIIMGSGYSYFRQYACYVIAGLINQKDVDVDLCGFGRMSFANPEFPKQIFLNGEIDKKKVCITCSKCSELMRLGTSTGCVLRDPQYKNLL